MTTLPSVSRRQFMTGIFSAGAASFLPWKEDVGKKPHMIKTHQLINALIMVMQDQNFRHDDYMHEEQKANLVYAFEKISPSNHLEEAIAVACGMSYQPLCHIVDEYVRRRKGEAARLPNHPVMKLKAWGVPDTYGVLIFRDQIDALVAELTDGTLGEGSRLCNKIMRDQVRENDLAALLSEKYQWLNGIEAKAIYDAIQFYAPTGRPYTWCSAMVNRAHSRLAECKV